MSTIAPSAWIARPTPRKLGAPERRNVQTREDWWRQLDYMVEHGELPVGTRDFLQAVSYAYSDKTAKDFWPAQSTMAELRDRSVRTVQRHVAIAKAAGVLLVAQLKGLDRSTNTWFCSSNTHRPSFKPEWAEKRKAERAARAAAKREARINARAPRPGSKVRPPNESRPAIPDVDLEEIQARRESALGPAEQAARAKAAREILLRPQPPPDA